ncbi:MAG TPA: MOSC N-terminal beta barrel domain-containing protein [Stellaceae bacterium]|nr:MOSC N-terminal beta barrel domain-containing protein [Stellaceae bacterium]
MSNGSGGVVAIYRYPVKGLSAEKMDRVVLTPGECLPHDRRFAIALGSTRFDPEHPEWLPKTHFIMLMRDEKLAQLRTHFDVESGVLAIAENSRVLLRAQITAAKGCELVAEFFTNFLGDATNPPLRVVAAPGTRLCGCTPQAERDNRSIRLADQPREPRGARSGDGRPD